MHTSRLIQQHSTHRPYSHFTQAVCPQSLHTAGAVTACAAGAGQTIVFGDTKSDVDETASQLAQTIAAKALHGDIAQSQREVTLKSFKNGGFSVLVATDVAARGLDISSAPPSACPPHAPLPALSCTVA